LAFWVVLLSGICTLASTGCGGRPPSPERPTPTVRASPAPDDLGPLLEAHRAAARLPALGGAVVRSDRLVAIGATGSRKLGDPARVTAGDRWHLGSNTKAMTATLVGLAIDRGALRFDETLREIFAGEALADGWANVTVGDLLQHRGGAPNDVDDETFEMLRAEDADPSALGHAVRRTLTVPPTSRGTTVYSNSGYLIVGEALERRLEAPWEELMRREIFAPLGMSSCGFGPPGSTGPVLQPWGHKQGEPPLPVLSDNPRGMGPAGSVHCSLEDWGRFVRTELRGLRGQGTFLSRSTSATLDAAPSGSKYASGWMVLQRKWASGTVYMNSGSNTTNLSIVWIAPALDFGFLVTTNMYSEEAYSALSEVVGAMIEKYAGIHVE
jgi:D-alanyl-D-alanine carboxypeptidase